MSTAAPAGSHTVSFVASENLIHEEAIPATGLSDFGDPNYLEGMRVALEALDTEAKLHEVGRAAVQTGMAEPQIREAFGPDLQR